jgi:hypothetical protein
LPSLASNPWQISRKLAQTREPLGVTFGLMLLNGALKLRSGEQLQDLGENAAYSIHGGSLLRAEIWFWSNPNSNLTRLSPKLEIYLGH